MDITKISDAELLSLVGQTPDPLATVPDEELLRRVGQKPEPNPYSAMPDEELLRISNAGTAESYANQAKRGAVSGGLWQAGEGMANLPRSLMTGAAAGIEKLGQAQRGLRAMGLPIGAPDDATMEKLALAKQALATPGALPNTGSQIDMTMAAGDWMADAYKTARAGFDRARPVRPDVAESFSGQLVQGIGQAVPTMAAGIVAAPVLPLVAAGQINQEALDDARQKGASEPEARTTAAAYLPAAGLDYLGDRFIIGKILKPLAGKVTIGEAAKHLAGAFGIEGGTEAAQQALLNTIEKLGFKPDQELTEGVVDSFLVGGATGAAVTGGGIAASEGTRRLLGAAEAQRLDRWAKALAPGGAGEAEAFQQALAADNSRRGVPEPTPAATAPTTLPAAATPTQQGGAGETATGSPSPQGVEVENPVGADSAPAGPFAEIDEILKAEAAQIAAQRAEIERRDQAQALQRRDLSDLVGEALRPRVAELAGKTDLERHDFWRGMQQVAESLASAQAGRSRDLDLPAVREQAAALFSGAKPALVDAIALKLHGTKPAESVAALRDFHKYAGQQRQPFAAAAQQRDAAEAERRAAAQAEAAARAQAVQAEVARAKQERASIAKTGRDLDGKVADWTALPDTDLETLAAANEADGFDPDEISGAQAEIERRSREQGAAQPLTREAQLRLIARYGGINPAHPVHAGEIATIRESEIGRDRKLWRDDGNSLDRLAEQIRQDVQNGPQTEADVLAWLGELAAGRTPRLYERGDVERDDIRFAAAARRADPLTEGITAEQLAAQVQPVEAPAGAWSDDNRANNQQLRALLAPLRGQTIAGVEITREGIKHLARLQENPLEFRVAAQLPALLSSSLPVGRPESTGERGPTIQRRIAAAVIDGVSVPVRITTKTFAGRTTLYHLETAERHSGISRRRAAERLEDRIESGVPSPTVADLLPDVKPQPDGTYTARFARTAAAPADQFVDDNKMVAPTDQAARRKIARLEKTFRRIMPALFRDVEVRIDNVEQALAAEGHETPEGVEAVYLPRPRAQRDLIVLAADVALRDDGRTGLARMLHESVHAYWRMLSPETRAALRRLYDRDLREQWSPLWRDGELATEVSQDDILSGDELGLEEWFSELMAALNAEWATRRGSSRVPGWVQDLATALREILAKVWRTVAHHKGLRGDALDRFLNRDFRAFLTRGVSARRTAAAGAAFARHAQAQAMLGLDTAMGIDLPREIAGLVPAYQDRSLRFESRLDKALYYVGAPGNTELRERLVASLQEQTGLTEGQIRSLARSVRDRLPGIVRSQPQDGTVRVPEIAPALAEEMVGVRYAQRQKFKPADITTPEFKAWFAGSKIVNPDGTPRRMYHGTQRPDRVGEAFDPKRATSGPMAYFTDSPEIASNYSTNKADTSNEIPESYDGWFQFKRPGDRRSVSLSRSWWSLTPQQRATIAQRLPDVNQDDDGNITWKPGQGMIAGDMDSWNYYLRAEGRGNPLLAAVEVWLTSGSLYGDEIRFLNVLREAGFPMDLVEFADPHAAHSAVFPVYLAIRNPLDTAAISQNVVDALHAAGAKKPAKQAAGGNPDQWDKNTISGKEWLTLLEEDRREGTLHVWTRIPDWVTDTLRSLGYDGILDTGGKNGGAAHIVAVPFAPTQIKSAFNRGSWDSTNKKIRFAQRQDPEDTGASRERFEATDAKVREIEAKLASIAAEEGSTERDAEALALRRDLAAARRERSKAYVEANATRVEADPVSQALNTNPRVRALREDIIRLTAAIDRAAAEGQPRDELLERRTAAQEEIEALRRQAERSLFPAAPAELPVDFGDANPPRNSEPPKTAPGAPDPEHLRPVRFDDFSGFTGPQLTERLAHLRAMQDNLPVDMENGERLQFLARLVRETREELESRRAGLEAEAEQAVAAPSATPDQQAREAEALAAERESAARDALDAEAAAAIPDVPAETYPVRDDVAEVASAVSAGTLAPTGRIAQWFASLGELLKGFRGAIPELPVFGEKARAYQNFREGMRLMASVPDVVRREAEEIVDDIVAPLRAHSTTAARDAQARLQQLHRRLAAEALPDRQAILRRIIRETEAQLASDPWWIFQNVILYGDLFTRSRLYRREDGSPIALPGGLNPAEAEHLFKQWLARAYEHPQKAAILEARKRHQAFVARIGADLKERGFVFAEGSNANYFPHVLLEKWDGNTANVKIGTAEDFRGYLITPVGSIKPIETDYLKAMYYHAAQVLAHNRHADIVRDYVASEDIRPKLIAEAAELTAQIRKKEPDAAPVTWRQIYYKRYAADFDLYTPDPGKIPLHPEMVINRDLLSKRLGLVLGSGPIAEELKKHGLADIPLRPEEVQEMLTAGARELWVLPKQMAGALRGIAARQSHADKLLQKVLAGLNGWWKKNILFSPLNYVRFEFNNTVSDGEKILTADPALAKGLIAAGKEVYAFLSGAPDASVDVREAFRLGVLDTLTAAEVNALRQQRPFEAWETSGERNARVAVNRLTSFFSSSRWNTMGWSKLREATFRYAKYKADLERLRHGATPKYAGAYWKNVEALRRVGAPEEIAEYTKAGRAFSRGGPGPLLSAQPYVLTWQESGRQREEAFASQAGRAKRREELESRQREADAALLARKAAAISRATFGDYGELTPNGNALRRLAMPFYAWTETNFRYHANLLRNLRDQVREGDIGAGAAAGKAALGLATTGTRAALGVALRLVLPYVAVSLWNALGSGVDDDELSEEDRRRFHLRLGHDENGKVQVVYLNTAFADVAKWFSGNRAAGLVADVAAGRTDLGTAADSFARNLLPDFANNSVGGVGPLVKVPYTLASGKATFPDVTDQSTIPSYDMRRAILGQMTDQTVADWIERAVNKDYVSPRSMGEWAQQAILQVRRRDPESWAFYAVKDKAAEYEERMTGRRDNRAALDAPEAQVLRQYRRAIYQADVPTAMRMYQRLLELGYTAERFEASIRSQDPLHGLPTALRRSFVESLGTYDRQQLRRAYRYYLRMQELEGSGRRLFPRAKLTPAGRQMWGQYDRSQVLADEIARAQATQDDDATAEQRIDRELAEALRRN